MSTATLNGAPPATAPSPFAGHASTGGNYETCPAGNHPAHLVAIYDLGTHDTEFQGDAKPDTRIWYLAWELSGELKADGTPHVLGKEYTVYRDKDGSFSFPGRSALRLMLEGWRGAKFAPGEPIDPGAALGLPCLLSVTHSTNKDKTYANIDGVKAMARGLSAPRRHHDLVAYLVTMGDPPSIPWLPKIWWRESATMELLDDVVRMSKEFTGRPIGNGKAKDTPYSEAVGGKSPAGTGETPDNGQSLFAWVKDMEQRHEVALLKYLLSWGKLMEFPDRLVDWDANQVAQGHSEAVRKLKSIQPAASTAPGATEDDSVPF